MSDETGRAQGTAQRSRMAWPSVLTAAASCVLVFVLWWSLGQREHVNLQSLVNAEAEYLAANVESDLRIRIPSLRRMSNRWELLGGMSRDEFMGHAGAHIVDYPGILSLQWIDRAFIVRWVVPLVGNERALNTRSATEQKRVVALKQAAGTGAPASTPAVDLLQGGKGFLVYFPVYVRGNPDGFIMAVFRVREWLDYAFLMGSHNHVRKDFRITAYLDDTEVYREEGWSGLQGSGLEAMSAVKVLDHELFIKIRPTPAFTAQHKTLLPELVACFGILLSLLLGLIVHLLGNAFVESGRTMAAKTALEHEVSEHRRTAGELRSMLERVDMATSAGGIGIWVWDTRSGAITWNERMYQLFGIPPDITPTYGMWMGAIHPDDQPAAEGLLNKAVAGRAVFNTEFRIRAGSGEVRHLGGAARVVRDDTGGALRVTGINWDITEIKQAEQVLRHKSEMQKILTNITSIYMNTPLGEVRSAVQNALKEMGSIVQADRAYIFDYDFSQGETSNSYEWCSEGIAPRMDALQKVPLADIQEWVDSHRSGQSLIIPDVSALPHGRLRGILEPQGIKSLIAIPMTHGGDLLGFVGFDSLVAHHRSTDEELGILHLFSQIIVNISLRSQSDLALRQSEEQVRLLLNSTAEAIYGLDPQGSCTFANPACLKMLGYTSMDQVLGRNMHRLIHHSYPDGRPMQLEMCRINQAIREGKGVHIDDEVLWRADGSCFPAEYWSYPQLAEGRVTGAVVTFIDITGRKEAEAEIKRQISLINSLIDSIPDIIFFKDTEGVYLGCNPPFIEFVGRPREQIIGHTDYDLFETGVADSFREHDRNMLALRRPMQNEEWITYPDGVKKLIDTLKTPYWGPGGDLIGLIGISRDITAQRQAQAVLKESEANFRTFFETMTDMIVVATPDGRIIYTNKTLEEKLGFGVDELASMHVLDLHAEDSREEAGEILASMFRGERDVCPLPLAHRNGPLVPVETRVWFGQWNGEECIFGISKDLSMEQEAQQRFERLFRNNPAPMALSTLPDHRIYDVNNAFEKLLGYTRSDVIGRTAAEVGLFPDQHQRAHAGERLQSDGRIADIELQVRRRDGAVLNGLFSGETFSSQGRQYLLTVMIDITERKQTEKLLASERQRLAYILEGTNVGTWEWNVQTGEVEFNERWAEMIGYTLEELKPVSLETWKGFVHPDDLASSNELLKRHFSGELPYYECETRMRHKDGSWVWVLDRGKVVVWSGDGKPLMMSGTHQDITQRKLAEEKIQYMANHDALTGLPSLRLAKDRLTMAVNLARRYHKLTAVMFIDLDGFKTVNDTLGHDAGDSILRNVAQNLLLSVRKTDTVARVGGDEFLIVAPDLSSRQSAEQIAEKVISLVSQPVTINGRQARVGASIGIALSPKNGEEIEQLIKLADEAMYKVKASGKNGFGFAETG